MGVSERSLQKIMNVKTKICSQITTGLALSTSLLLGSIQTASAYESTKLSTRSGVMEGSHEQCVQKATSLANSALVRTQTNNSNSNYFVAGSVGDSRATIRCIKMPQGTAVTITAHTCISICPASGCESQSIVKRFAAFMFE